jgi:transposase-like protein
MAAWSICGEPSTEGKVLDVLVQTKRNKRAALKLMRKLLKKYGFVPDKLITDELRSFAAAAGRLGIAKRHERGRWRNNRAENSHQPTPTKGEEDARVQERGIRVQISLSACSSSEHLQRPASSHLSKNAPSLQGVGHAYMARSRRCGVSPTGQEICCVHYLAM